MNKLREPNFIERVGLHIARPYLRDAYIYSNNERKKHKGTPLEQYWMGRMTASEIALRGRFWSRFRLWKATRMKTRKEQHGKPQ